jgi:hypothetical protein
LTRAFDTSFCFDILYYECNMYLRYLGQAETWREQYVLPNKLYLIVRVCSTPSYSVFPRTHLFSRRSVFKHLQCPRSKEYIFLKRTTTCKIFSLYIRLVTYVFFIFVDVCRRTEKWKVTSQRLVSNRVSCVLRFFKTDVIV